MKLSRLSKLIPAAVLALGLWAGADAHAQTAREDLVHSYVLLKLANRDHGGHRAAAIREVEAAGKELGLTLEGHGSDREQQWKSDDQLREARRVLRVARDRLEAKDRDRVAAHLDRAIGELDAALRVE
jgi:hypothetical protein